MSGVNCGTGNIDANPLFADSTNGDYHLQDTSPCKDTGNQASQYNDPEDPNPPSGRALDPPSKGTVRNDMGAYGGPDAGIVGATAP